MGGDSDKIILTGGVNNSDIIDNRNVTVTDRMVGVLRKQWCHKYIIKGVMKIDDVDEYDIYFEGVPD